VGYGEQYLLVNTPYENWENRRVTLRRVDEFLR
jgi:outer membrane protein OmpA-like peptidoglycan-associated protein